MTIQDEAARVLAEVEPVVAARCWESYRRGVRHGAVAVMVLVVVALIVGW